MGVRELARNEEALETDAFAQAAVGEGLRALNREDNTTPTTLRGRYSTGLLESVLVHVCGVAVHVSGLHVHVGWLRSVAVVVVPGTSSEHQGQDGHRQQDPHEDTSHSATSLLEAYEGPRAAHHAVDARIRALRANAFGEGRGCPTARAGKV